MLTAQQLRNAKRRLRRHKTPSEKLFASRLQDGGFKIREQIVVGFYIADIVIPNRLLIIELDGAHHAEPDQRAHDNARDAFLIRSGFTVLRIQNEDSAAFPLEQIRSVPLHPIEDFRSCLARASALKGAAIVKMREAAENAEWMDSQRRAQRIQKRRGFL